jgi:hypothetical protein
VGQLTNYHGGIGERPAMIKCGTFQDIPRLPRRELDHQLKGFGKGLRELRETYDLSMGEIARFLKCSPALISDLELGAEQDPAFVWCSKCGGGDGWRRCLVCGGHGYVKVGGPV